MARSATAIVFDGKSHRDLVLESPIHADRYTIEGWVRPSFLVGAGAIVEDALVFAARSGEPLRFGEVQVGSHELPISQWAHLAVVRTAADKCTLYINGRAIGAGPTVGPRGTSLRVGAGFCGEIGGLRCWREALDEAELRRVAISPPAGPKEDSRLLGALALRADEQGSNGPASSLVALALPGDLTVFERSLDGKQQDGSRVLDCVELSAYLGSQRLARDLLCALKESSGPVILAHATVERAPNSLVVRGNMSQAKLGPIAIVATVQSHGTALGTALNIDFLDPEKAAFAVGGLKLLRFVPDRIEYHFDPGNLDSKNTAPTTEMATFSGKLTLSADGHSNSIALPVKAELHELAGPWRFRLVDKGEASPSLSNLLSLVGGESLVASLADVVKKMDDAKVRLTELDVDVHVLHGTIARFGLRVASSGDEFWTIAEGITIKSFDVAMAIHDPLDAWRRRYSFTLNGNVKLGVDLSFRLSNETGVWLLTPQERRLSMKKLGTFRDKLGLGDAALPDWLGKIADHTELVGLEMGFVPSTGRITHLAGAIEWTDLPFPGLSKSSASIDSIALALTVQDPFGTRAVAFAFSGKARFLHASGDRSKDRVLTLSGGNSGSGWRLSAALRGDLPLTDMLATFAATVGAGEAAEFLAKISLSLVNPEFTIGPNSGDFSVGCGISINQGEPIPMGGGSFKLTRGSIDIQRSSGTLSWRIAAGCDFKFDTGLALADSYVYLGDDGVRLGTFILFPGEKDDERIGVHIDGSYSKKAGLKLAGRQNDKKIALKPAIEKIAGSSLSGFPNLFASDLEVTIDTGNKQFTAGGTATASSFWIDNVEIRDATFQFELDSRIEAGEDKKRSTAVSLCGQAKILRSRTKTENLTEKDFIEITLRIDSDGASSDYLATIGNLSIADFGSAFGVKVGKTDDFTLEGLGFRYRSQAPAKEGETPPVAPAKTLSFFTESGSFGRFDVAFAKKNDQDSFHPLVMVKPKSTWLQDAKVGFGGASFKDVPLGSSKIPLLSEKGPLGTTERFSQGLFFRGTFILQGTVVEKRLGISDAVKICVEDKITIELPARKGVQPLEIPLKSQQATPPKKVEALPARTPERDETPAKAETKQPLGEEGETTFRFDKTLSLAPIVGLMAPAKQGGSTAGTWRDYVGNFIVVSNMGVTLSAKPQPHVVVFADISMNVGSWLSVTAAEVSVSIGRSAIDFDIQGGGVTIDIPPWIKGGAAVLKRKTETSYDIYGMGELQLLQKVRIAALTLLSWAKTVDEVTTKTSYKLDAGFGFVCATGLNIAVPPIVITGIAGGFGYRAIPKLPDKPEGVVDNTLVKMLTDTTSTSAKPATANAMIEQLRQFDKTIERRDDSWCALVGLTFTVAQVVNGAVLAVLESRPTGIEVALLGYAAFTLGAKRSGDVSSGKDSGVLGHIELGLLARFSAQSGTISILGAITRNSWVFDEGCKLSGGFALCYWGKGDHAGDFLVSVGGYSPLQPKPAHYPELDRVGFRWDVDSSLSLGGNAYLCLDRHSLAVGCAADLRYTKPKVNVKARFSFDALVQWAPLYYEAQLRINVQVDIQVLTTLRLGLDVEMHLWGPPFGAKLHVEIDLWPVNPSFTVTIGPSLDEVKRKRDSITIDDVVALAAGGNDRSTMTFLSNREPAKLLASTNPKPSGRVEYTSVSPCSGDDFTISMETAIPVTDVTVNDKNEKTMAAGLQVRAKKWSDVRSELSIRVKQRVSSANEQWVPVLGTWCVEAESRPALESLWCIPENADAPWKTKPRELISALHIRPPTENAGKSYKDVRLKCWETLVAAVDGGRDALAVPRPAPSKDDANRILRENSATRSTVVEALKKAGFGLGGASAGAFRALEDAPLISRLGGVS